ncbi:unnamed protein product [Arabidopsis arenosa]|uniref:DUF4283 domain-containing protein n=1 Tax=Arabidopsis arenosa TaxID=38785 RepID=A0A8S2AXJ3_ARAAE|nr:unnamed protein product [Arabidopsis arenosa]
MGFGGSKQANSQKIRSKHFNFGGAKFRGDSDEVFENVTPLWEDFLIGKFLDTAPHVAKVHVIVNKIWKQGFDAQKIDVYEVNSTTLRFRDSNPLIRARVLKRGMWNIAEVPMVVTKWTPNAEKEQQEEKSVPLCPSKAVTEAPILVSASKFSVLCTEEEEEGELQETEEKNDDDDDEDGAKVEDGQATAHSESQETKANDEGNGGCSDHLRSRIQIQREKVAKRKPFKFTNSIATMPEFLPLLQSYWQDTPTLFHSTSAMFRFSKKLKNLKPQLRNLSREKLGNLQKRVTVAFKDLCEKQKETLLRPTDTASKEETEAYHKWNHLAELEEKFLKQRSKLHLLDVGDQNNKVFHNAVKLRVSKNSIREIQLPDGSIVSSQEEIKHEAERFFSEFLGHVPTEFEGLPADILEVNTFQMYICSSMYA